MAARKSAPKATATKTAPPAEESPLQTAVAGKAAAAGGTLQAATAVDVFTAAQATPAATTSTSAVKAETSTGKTKQLTEQQRDMAEARGAGRLTEDELRNLGSSKPGADEGATGDSLKARVGSIGGGTARADRQAEIEAKRQELEDLHSDDDESGPNVGDFQRGAMGGDLVKTAADVTGDVASGIAMTTGAMPGEPSKPSGTGMIADEARPIWFGGPKPARWDQWVADQEKRVRVAPDGTMSWKNEDGTSSTMTTNGTILTTDPEGNTTESKASDGKANVPKKAPDEPIIIVDENGKVISGGKPKGTGVKDPGAPDLDGTVDPDAVLRWQAYLKANGLLINNDPNSLENTSNPSPEATGGGGGPVTGIRAQTKTELIGQPGRTDEAQSGGGGSVTGDQRRAWASNPGPDGSVSDGGKQIEEDPGDTATGPSEGVTHLAPTAEDDDDTQSATRRFYAGRLTSTKGSDDDD